MRIERTGKIEPLTPRIERYLKEALSARSLDDAHSSEQRRPDYVCLKDILVVEVKTLEGDGTERIENLNDQLREREDYPPFYGKVPVESLLKNLSDPEAVRRKLSDRIGRAIVTHLRKADGQLAAHAERFPRKNLVRLVILVNEDHELYEPNIVGFIVHRALSRLDDNGKPAYGNIDAVIYMTERHATQIDGKVAFPLLAIHGRGIDIDPWKEAFLHRFTDGWAAWNGNPLYDNGSRPDEFEAMDHIPERMRRQDLWNLEYRRNRYMKDIKDERLREHFDESIVMSMLSMMINSPIKPTQQQITDNLRWSSHLLLEINARGIPMTRFAYSLERTLAAARRLRMSQQVLDWFTELDRQRNMKA
ncbi:MAG: hypothetical protein WDM86_09240 [Rhizomicrobium sp.]